MHRTEDPAAPWKRPTGTSRPRNASPAQVANLLYQMEHAHKFDELVMVAPPKMLGDLRARLHREVADCVIAEVARDLTGHPLPDIGRLLS